MAKIGGVNGAFSSVTHTTASGFYADFATIELEMGQAVDESTSYGDNAQRNIGNGLPGYRINAGGFMRNKQASATPGLGTVTGTTLATGGTVTATFDTGTTFAIGAIFSNSNISHGRRSPLSPIRFAFIGDNSGTETWATS